MLVVSKLSSGLNRVQVVFKQTTGFQKVQISEDRRRLQLGKLGQSKTRGRSGGEIRKEAHHHQ